MTTLRFTGNGQGYHAPVTAMARALFTGRRLSQTLPGLAGFYMVGQWAGVAGVPMVAAMGRDVVHAICRKERRQFATDVVAVRRAARRSSGLTGTRLSVARRAKPQRAGTFSGTLTGSLGAGCCCGTGSCLGSTTGLGITSGMSIGWEPGWWAWIMCDLPFHKARDCLTNSVR